MSNPDGAVVGAVAAHTAITSTIRQQEASQEHSERFRTRAEYDNAMQEHIDRLAKTGIFVMLGLGTVGGIIAGVVHFF